ncbi:M23 family metallopeptidase [Burkholderia sp. BKH01]|uniref:M23 family metallopeptidase n=1 Tax=Burkholderia sp. BKH01 TaxID=2769262 RepID=UPI0021E0A5D9|nr:M23 family metallopeptidase [Burkholderia sp. BKH01]MCU9956991.1 M23 family metallopeptidase [Burkholderia sp. BKH01]
MIISPPFLPEAGLVALTGKNSDPMMDAVDKFECAHGIYPIAFDRRWHCGVHLQPDTKGEVYAIADGEVVAYRVCQHGVDSGKSHTGFVLLKHTTETGEGRALTFYSLYMHLLPLVEYQEHGADSKDLPYEFLRMPTGPVSKGQVTPAVSGEGKKVRRKDVLGWLGKYEGMPHLHFEIFMLPADFDAYFGHTQLGNSTPTPPAPTETDWWGHAYFVIPAGSQFRRLPEKADAHNKLHGIAFEPGHEGSNALPLLVETYFSLGSKYTNVWSVAQDGTRTLLTPRAVEEKDYEYSLYKRAKALYSPCPSDGYELLRFGRILSTPTMLTDPAVGSPSAVQRESSSNTQVANIPNQRVTWMKVTWATGLMGYIDINDSNIHKFSDADFLRSMGWQKISDDNTPFDSGGLCDVGALKKILKAAVDSEQATVVLETTEVQKANVLSRYVKYDDQVRQQLRGFVCNAPSEWDSTHNEERYAKLLDEGGFYHGNDKGYNDFLKYLKEVQFWSKTGLPAGRKLWFFHPLAFIRHFRKCGWLSKTEISQIYSESNYAKVQKNGDQYREKYRVAINRVFRKYGICDPVRVSHFLGQIAVESYYMMAVREANVAVPIAIRTNHASIMPESNGYLRTPLSFVSYFHNYENNVRLGNTSAGDGVKFRGRGFKQLTGRYNYSEYWVFRGWLDGNSYNHAWFSRRPPGDGPVINNPELVGDDTYSCADTAGFFCVRYPVKKAADAGISESASRAVSKIINPYDVNSPPLRWEETQKAYQILGDKA